MRLAKLDIEVKENQPIKFVTYRNRAKKDGSKSKTDWFSTHPTIEARIEALRNIK